VSFIAPLVPLALSNYLSTNEVVEFFMISVISVLSSLLFIWILGMKRSERVYFVEFLKKGIKSK